MTSSRITVIPRQRGVTPKICSFWCHNEGQPYRCMHDITREVSAWDHLRAAWVPQMRVCHWHAIECSTGKPVLMPTYAERQADMLKLGA